MNKAIICRKEGMTQIFTAEGKVIPVTVLQAGPCPVIQIKTVEKDGYAALKLGFGETSEKALTKPELGQFKKAKVKPCTSLLTARFGLRSVSAIGMPWNMATIRFLTQRIVFSILCNNSMGSCILLNAYLVKNQVAAIGSAIGSL